MSNATVTLEHSRTTDRLAGAVEHLESRFARFEDEHLDLRDYLNELSNGQSRLEPAVHILSAQMKAVQNKPPVTGTVIAGVSVGITIFALALTPVAWLSVSNATRLVEQQQTNIELAYQRGAASARLTAMEHNDADVEDRFKEWNYYMMSRLDKIEEREIRGARNNNRTDP